MVDAYIELRGLLQRSYQIFPEQALANLHKNSGFDRIDIAQAIDRVDFRARLAPAAQRQPMPDAQRIAHRQ